MAISFIQMGEAIYSFSDIAQRDDEVASQIYSTSLQQLVIACAGFVVALLAVALWKHGTVDVNILYGLSLFTFFTSVYVLAVLFQQRLTMVKYKSSSVRELRVYSHHTGNVMYGDVVLFGLLFSLSLLMMWLYVYGDKEEEH